MNGTKAPRVQFRNNASISPASIGLGRISQTGILPQTGGIPFRKMRILGSYAIVYVVEGSGRYRDAKGADFKVTAGDCLLIFPELAHSYGPGKGESWSEIYLVFEGAAFDLWRKAGIFGPDSPLVHLEPISLWQEKLENFIDAPWPLTPNDQATEASRLLQLLTEIAAINTKAGAVSPADWLTHACAILEANLEREVSLESVAQQVGLSYESFRKQFQQQTGISPARFRAGRVIDAACSLMQGGEMTNKEIARRLNFADEYYFSRRFKQVTGVTPREFRRRLPQMP